jgi:hypothetical protein
VSEPRKLSLAELSALLNPDDSKSFRSGRALLLALLYAGWKRLREGLCRRNSDRASVTCDGMARPSAVRLDVTRPIWLSRLLMKSCGDTCSKRRECALV